MSRFFSDSGQKLRNLRIWRREGGSHWRDREGCHTRAMGVRRRHRTGAGWAPATAALLMAACVRGRFCNESEPLMPYEVRREWRGCLQLFNNESGWARHHMKMQHRTMLIGNNPLIANVTWSWVTYSSGLMLKRWTARYTDAWGDLREMDIDLSQWKNWFTIRETDDWLSKSIQSFIPYDNELCNSIHKGLDFCPGLWTGVPVFVGGGEAFPCKISVLGHVCECDDGAYRSNTTGQCLLCPDGKYETSKPRFFWQQDKDERGSCGTRTCEASFCWNCEAGKYRKSGTGWALSGDSYYYGGVTYHEMEYNNGAGKHKQCHFCPVAKMSARGAANCSEACPVTL